MDIFLIIRFDSVLTFSSFAYGGGGKANQSTITVLMSMVYCHVLSGKSEYVNDIFAWEQTKIYITLTTLKYICISHEDQMVFFNLKSS